MSDGITLDTCSRHHIKALSLAMDGTVDADADGNGTKEDMSEV